MLVSFSLSWVVGILLLVSSLFCAAGAQYIADKWSVTAPRSHWAQTLKFGQSACTSPDGSRVFIGANGYENFRGVVYVYDLSYGSGFRPRHWKRTVLTGSISTAAEVKKPGELRLIGRGSGFGFSCAVDDSGDNVLIGAPGQDVQTGVVYAFSYSKQTKKWTEHTIYEGPSRRTSDSFGWALASSADGSIFAVSAKGRRANNGEVYVFHCPSGPLLDCRVAATLYPPDATNENGPRGIRIRNNFGVSLDMSKDGRIVAIGCTGPKSEQGIVYVMTHDENVHDWRELQRLEPPIHIKFAFFGYKVSLDAAGRTLAVGSDGENKYQGSVYVFERADETSVCSADPFARRDGGVSLFAPPYRIRPAKQMENDNFGGSLALSGSGQILAIGCPGLRRNGEPDHGGVFFYRRGVNSTEQLWELIGRDMLPNKDAASGTFYSWALALDYYGGRVVATAPEALQSSGIATMGSLADLEQLDRKSAELPSRLSALGKLLLSRSAAEKL